MKFRLIVRIQKHTLHQHTLNYSFRQLHIFHMTDFYTGRPS